MVKYNIRGTKVPIFVSDNMMKKGWYGGQFVKYIAKNTVDFADNINFAGLIILGYKLEDNKDIPYEHENVAVKALNQATLMYDSGLYEFNDNVYDKTLIYTYNQTLYINNNGIITNINSGGTSIGKVSAIPQDNNGWLGVLLLQN